MNGRFAIKRQQMFALLIFWIWAQEILLQYIRAVLIRLPLIGVYSDIVLTAFFIAIVFFAIPCFRIHKSDILLLFFIIAVFVLEYFLYKSGQVYLEKYAVSFLIKILPLYFVGVSFGKTKDREKIVYQMYIISMLTLISAIVYRIVFGASMSDEVSKYVGDMDHAYKILPHCCLIAYYAVKRTNVLNLICVAIGGFYLLILGTRGAVLLYLVLVAVLLIMGRTSKGAVSRTVILFVTVGGFVISSWYDTAILWMYQKARQLGLSVRIFDKLIKGELAVSGGRDTISETLLYAIKENPFLGYGLCSDRVLAGNYAHNIALELWVEFGIIFGTAILIIVFVVLFRGYRATEEEGKKGLILALIFASFFKLFLSGSYLDERLLPFLMGMCVGSIRQGKRKNVMNQRYIQ